MTKKEMDNVIKTVVIGIGCVVASNYVGKIGGTIGDRLTLNVASRESYELTKSLFEDVRLANEENLTYNKIDQRVTNACRSTAIKSAQIGFFTGLFSLLVGSIVGKKIFPKLKERL